MVIRFIRYTCFCFLLLSPFGEIKAQVYIPDSLALVALYNKVPALADDGTWLNGDVSTWSHVTLLGNRVTTLFLDNVLINDVIPAEICGLDALVMLSIGNCQLKGVVPACIFEMSSLTFLSISSNQLTGVEPGADLSLLTQIQSIYISNNQFNEMPDFLSITSPVFNNLDVRNNDFNFDDLIPLINKPNVAYLYAPQHPVTPPLIFYVNVGDTVDFPDAAPSMGGTGNTYDWKLLIGSNTFTPPPSRFKNITESIMRVEGAELIDNQLFHCKATNPNLPGLVLQTGTTNMVVTDPFMPQFITYLSDTIAYCNDPALLLTATTNAGKPVTFTSLNTSLATVNPDNTLNIHALGTFTIQATAPGDALYHNATLDINITIASHLSLPVFTISKILPEREGDDLHLSVQEVSSLNYIWTTPFFQSFNTASITVSPLTNSELGTYHTQIFEGTCLHGDLSINIDELGYGEPVIYELITPNGDGKNDTFYISDLNPSVYNEVSVFNVWNQIVYHQENYRNDWDGGNLPVGTYYYVIKLGRKIHKGNLYIKN